MRPTYEQMRDMLIDAENVLKQAIELKEENRELKIKIAKLEDVDEELDQNMKEFRLKVEMFGVPESRGDVNEPLESKKQQAN